MPIDSISMFVGQCWISCLKKTTSQGDPPHIPLTRDRFYVRKAFGCPQFFNLILKINLSNRKSWIMKCYMYCVISVPRYRENRDKTSQPIKQAFGHSYFKKNHISGMEWKLREHSEHLGALRALREHSDQSHTVVSTASCCSWRSLSNLRQKV